MSILEAGMLVCFGASWPFAIVKTYKTKNVKGISFIFLILLLLGYIFGILHKIIFNFDYVLIFYIFNGSLVLTEIVLYLMYKDNDKAS
ncbi:MAG: hypothetical protein A2Y25_07645 [Candidatus Melainabacteria bacterium GWF2_37_15]|nr:MAG: hypothetical protein A2Y25_07645 [Candidatus Melainabacteria bacterium GWF2_37_15]